MPSLWSQMTNQGAQNWTQQTENAFFALPVVRKQARSFTPHWAVLQSVHSDRLFAGNAQLGVHSLSSLEGMTLFRSPQEWGKADGLLVENNQVMEYLNDQDTGHRPGWDTPISA